MTKQQLDVSCDQSSNYLYMRMRDNRHEDLHPLRILYECPASLSCHARKKAIIEWSFHRHKATSPSMMAAAHAHTHALFVQVGGFIVREFVTSRVVRRDFVLLSSRSSLVRLWSPINYWNLFNKRIYTQRQILGAKTTNANFPHERKVNWLASWEFAWNVAMKDTPSEKAGCSPAQFIVTIARPVVVTK